MIRLGKRILRRPASRLVKRRSILTVALILFAASFANGAAYASPSQVNSVPDQAISAPTPVSGETGSPTSGASYSTEYFDDQESMVDGGVNVYTSTDAGTFGLTGIVLDDVGGNVISGATVTLTPSGGGRSISTTTDSDGAFAFVDVPVSGSTQDYDLTVSADGFGSYSVVNETYAASETYYTTAEMETTSQAFDEAAPLEDNTLGPTDAAGSSGYPSNTKVPPSLHVKLYNHDSGTCDNGGNLRATKNYPWKFYVLHVAAGEIDTQWHKTAWKANAAAEQNYAWYFRIQGTTVNNTTQYQCFRPERSIPTSWKDWIPDVLDERIANSNGNITITQYRAGNSFSGCTDRTYPQNGNILSQWGSKSLDDNGCYSAWSSIDDYYYSSSVKNGSVPDQPSTDYSKSNGKITFNFDSTGGWHYVLQKYGGGSWNTIATVGWSWKMRDIPKSHTYDPNGNCYEYRVKATNPVDSSSWKVYNNGNTICA